MSLSLTSEALSESDDERAQEIGTIASIFPEELTILTHSSGVLLLPVSPLDPLAVSCTSEEAPVRLEHLPPVKLKFELPETYPAEAAPHLELSTTPAWLPAEKLAAVQQQCLDLWEECGRSQVVWAIIDHVQQGAERAFDVEAPLQVADELRKELVDFDKKTKHDIFNQGTYDCGICLEPKKGTVCYALRSCGHVFCRPCLTDYYTGLIKEGEVNSVRCSDPTCVKSATRPQAAPPTPPPDSPDDADAARRAGALASLPATLPPEELAEIGIPADLVTRYVVMKKKKALEKDPNTIYCPRQWCQAPTRASVQHMEETMRRNGSGYWLPDRDAAPLPALQEEAAENKPSPLKEKLQVCSVCAFAFCRVCLASWHGDFQICKPADGTLTEDEIANENFLRANTTPCPTCQSPVLKSHGCNHMICACATHFCFLCSAYLPADNPYTHFNTRGTECYQRLWEGEEGDVENQRANLQQPDEEQIFDDDSDEEEPEPQQGQPAAAAAAAPPPPPPPEHQEIQLQQEEFLRFADNVIWIDGLPLAALWEMEELGMEDELSDHEEVPFARVPDVPAPDEPAPAARGGERGRARRGGRRGGRGGVAERGRGRARGAPVEGARGDRGGGARGDRGVGHRHHRREHGQPWDD